MLNAPCIMCGSLDDKPVRIRKDRKYPCRSKYCRQCVRELARDKYHWQKENDPSAYKRRVACNNRHSDRRNKSDKFKAYRKRWEMFNATRRKNRKRELYLLNRESILERNRLWKEKNRARLRAKGRADGRITRHVWRQWENQRISEVKLRLGNLETKKGERDSNLDITSRCGVVRHPGKGKAKAFSHPTKPSELRSSR